MRVPRIYHPEPLVAGSQITLRPEAAQYLRTVLRLKAGDALTLFDGSGSEFETRLESFVRNRMTAVVGTAHRPPVESPLHVTLVQGISRGERMDYTVQKSVELGVSEIIPVLAERSVVRLDAGAAERKRGHWQSVAVGACEQSSRVRVPTVRAPMSLGSLFSEPLSHGLKLLLDPEANSAFSDLLPPQQKRILLLVGPEGGLSGAERGAATRAGFQGVRLGPRILRTETAALVALSLLQGCWGDLAGN